MANSTCNPPVLSLVVSTIGRTDTFLRLLDSLDRCDRVDEIEVVLVDQSADQRCIALLRSRPVSYRWYATTSGPGVSRGRNVGLRWAHADIVGFPDDDCWYRQDTIRRVLDRFEADPSLDGLSGRQITSDGRSSALRWASVGKRVTPTNFHRTTISSTLFLRRRLLEAVGDFDEGLGIGSTGWFQAGEESDLVLRAIARRAHIRYEPTLVVYHDEARDLPTRALADKMLGYGCGQGHLWRAHHWPVYRIVHLLVRKTTLAVIHWMAGRKLLAQADLAFVRGCVAGLRDRPPRMGGSQSDTSGGSLSDPVREARRSFLARLVTAGMGLTATLALTILAVRLLNPTGAAAFLSIVAALMIGPLLGRLGLGQSAVRLLATNKGQAGDASVACTHLWAAVTFSLATAPVVAFVATGGLDGAQRLVAVVLASALIVLESLRLTVSDVFAALGRIGWSVATTHSVRAIAVLVGFAVYLILPGSPTLTGLLVSCLFVAAALAVVPLSRLARLVPLRQPPRVLPMLSAGRAGVVAFAVDLAAFAIGRGDVWLASYAFDPLDAARYSIASVLAYQAAVPIGLANMALAPTVVRLWEHGHHHQLRRLLDAISTVATAVIVVVVATLWLLAEPVVALAYGEALRPAGLLLAILATGTIAIAAFGSSSVLLVMTGRGAGAALGGIVVVLAVAPVAVAIALLGGPVALAGVSALATPILLGTQWVFARKVIGLAPTPSLQLRPALAHIRGNDLKTTSAVPDTAP